MSMESDGQVSRECEAQIWAFSVLESRARKHHVTTHQEGCGIWGCFKVTLKKHQISSPSPDLPKSCKFVPWIPKNQQLRPAQGTERTRSASTFVASCFVVSNFCWSRTSVSRRRKCGGTGGRQGDASRRVAALRLAFLLLI